MKRNFLNLVALAILGGVPFSAAHAADSTIRANAKIIKSLTLAKKQDLDFGTITLSGATGSYTVAISMTGALTCPSGATCAGTPLPAIMNVQGSNNNTVRITVAATNLVNSVNGSTIAFTPVAPATMAITNSGAPGHDFNIGGSIVVPATADGTYSGNVQVTVDYQ